MNIIPKAKLEFIFYNCLFNRKEDDEINFIKVYGFFGPINFNSEKIETRKNEIEELLEFVPAGFKKSSNGCFYLYYCDNTPEWREYCFHIEMLMQLGTAIGRVETVFHKESEVFFNIPHYSVVGL